MKLRIGNVRGERVEDAGHGGSLGNVLDDDLRMSQPPLRSPVMAQRVCRHLALAFRPKRDQVPNDVRPLGQSKKPVKPSVRVRSPKRPRDTQQGNDYEVDALALGRLDGGDRTVGWRPKRTRGRKSGRSDRFGAQSRFGSSATSRLHHNCVL